MCVVCAFRVCVCVSVSTPTKSTIKNCDQIFLSHYFGASEARLTMLCIHMTNFN